MRPSLIASLFASLLCQAFAANGASFDCGTSNSAQEKIICADRTLSALDSELSGMYFVALAISPNPKQVREKQRSWLAQSRNLCQAAACLKAAYEARLKELDALADRHLIAFPATLSVSESFEASKSPYCQSSGSGGYFSIDAKAGEGIVKVTLDGVHDCGRKVWGEIEGTGPVRGKLAIIEFRGGFHDDNAKGKAILAVGRKRVVWKVFEEVEAESYVPREQVFREAP